MKIFLLALSFFFVSPWAMADQASDGPFAIVELFGSEGCSSCPSAELLVSKLTTWARQNNEPIYPLAFHVDYWNNLGWRDIFSRPEYTQRQTQYAKIFKDQGGVYTPEMIVNGNDAFTGSNEGQLQQDLNHELSQKSNGILHISVLKKQPDEAIIKYDAQGFSAGDVINMAVVERGLMTDVTAGENAGRILHQDNVVREFQSLPLKGLGQISLSLERISDLSQASVIAYVQNPQTMSIEDAKQVDLEND